MIVEKILNKILEISTPLLLFFDKEEEYKEEILAINDSRFKVLMVDKNYFKIKYELEILYPNEKVLLYHPFEKPSGISLKNYPLTDLIYANEELLIDESADLLAKYAIHHSHAPIIMQFKRYVKAAKYQKKLLPVLSAKPFNEYRFKNTILSFILNESKVGNETMNLIKLFEIASESEESFNKIFQLIKRDKLESFLSELIYQVVHIHIEEVVFTKIQSLFYELKYNILTKNIKVVSSEDPYHHLKVDNELTLSKVELFFKEWMDDRSKSKTLDHVLTHFGQPINEANLVKVYGAQTEFGIKTANIIQHEIESLTQLVKDNPLKVIETIISWKTENTIQEDYQYEIDFLWHTAKYYNLIKNYRDFDFNYIEDYIKNYESELFALDLHYRHAFTAYQILDREKEVTLFTEVFSLLNKSYDQFLIDLNQSWLKILEENQFDINAVKVSKQYNFYEDHIDINPNKKVVIISDGFRFELAKDLVNELRGDSTNRIELNSMIASIPSYTNLGMSNLLPNDEIEAIINDKSIDYSIKGIKTNSANREKIIQLVEPNATVEEYAQFMRLSISEQRDVLKANKVTYIYHNWMDAIGDKRNSEYYTFEAVEQCIDQLKLLIKKLYNSLNMYNIYVTSDHGFLFNYNQIKENSRQVFPEVKSILKEHTRFCITTDYYHSKESYTIPLKNTTNIKSEANVILPKGINRFKKLGGFGVQFVHGGASLQELVVPVLFLSRQRHVKVSDVTFTRIDQVSTMANSSAKFKILQEHAVGQNYQAITISVGIYDIKNQLLTNEVELDLNMTSNQPSERVVEFRLELNSLGSSASVGYLRAYYNKDHNKLNPIINDLIKINTLTEIDEF